MRKVTDCVTHLLFPSLSQARHRVGSRWSVHENRSRQSVPGIVLRAERVWPPSLRIWWQCLQVCQIFHRSSGSNCFRIQRNMSTHRFTGLNVKWKNRHADSTSSKQRCITARPPNRVIPLATAKSSRFAAVMAKSIATFVRCAASTAGKCVQRQVEQRTHSLIHLLSGNMCTKCRCRVAWPWPVSTLVAAIVSARTSTIQFAGRIAKLTPMNASCSWRTVAPGR